MKKLILLTILIVSCGKKEPDNIEQRKTFVTDSFGNTCYYTENTLDYYTGNTLDYCETTIDLNQNTR
jgi:hypothetical protein